MGKTTTFIGGPTSLGFIAPYVLDGAMDGPTYKAWTEQMPAPELMPGDIVIMDNLAAHKVQGVRQAIEAKGAERRYLPPYSPDLSPSNVSRRSIRPYVANAPTLALLAEAGQWGGHVGQIQN